MRIGILTVSDRVSAGRMEDLGGNVIEQALEPTGWTVERQAVVPDDRERIAAVLRGWADEVALDLIFTTGGTGMSQRDVTPEATSQVLTREVPGLADAIRIASLEQTQNAMLSRGVSGVRGRTIIVNLPGSPRGAAHGINVILPVLDHAHATLHGANH